MYGERERGLGTRGWALAVALAAGAALHAQQPTFSGANRTVAVYATVTDASGRLVPDLTRDKFQIDDSGKPQELTIFANDIQPITVVMLLDRSTSMRRNFELVEKAAEAFVGVMLPADKARIGSFSDRIQVDPRDFTADHGELLRILRTELQFEGPTPLWNAVNVGITALLHQQGRRVILVFTDGVDAPGNGRSTNASLKDIVKLAEEEDVMIYAIGLAGQNGSSSVRPSNGGFGAVVEAAGALAAVEEGSVAAASAAVSAAAGRDTAGTAEASRWPTTSPTKD
jgi:VWFA-related protein